MKKAYKIFSRSEEEKFLREELGFSQTTINIIDAIMETEKQYKRVPFNIELLQKVISSEVEGRIIMACLNNAAYKAVNIQIYIDALDHISRDEYAALYHTKEMGTQRALIYFNIRGNYKYDRPNLHYDKAGELYIEVPIELPKYEFKPFDKVLVRGRNSKFWQPEFFKAYTEQFNTFVCIGTPVTSWEECIPYEGHEYLTFTKDEPKEVMV